MRGRRIPWPMLKPLARRLIRGAIVATALIVIATLTLSFRSAPVPLPVLSAVTRLASNWVLTDGLVQGSGALHTVSAFSKRFLAAWLQNQYVGHIDSRIDTRGDDPEVLTQSLAGLAKYMVARVDLGSSAIPRPALLLGNGYCDQVNGAAAELLARHFDTSELWTVRDPRTGLSPHTIGRVWSSPSGGWLYWDIYFGETVIFRRADGRTNFLISPTEEASRPYTLERRLQWYGDLVDHGRTLNAYHATFGQHLWSELLQFMGQETATPEPDQPPATQLEGVEIRAASEGQPPHGPAAHTPRCPLDESSYGTGEDYSDLKFVRSRYLDARVAHLSGQHGRALRLYQTLDPGEARTCEAWELARSAELLALRNGELATPHPLPGDPHR